MEVQRIPKALLEKVITGKRDERVYMCEQEFALFAMYYFAEYFTYAIPGFQWLMYKLLQQFAAGKFRFLLWVMFRESAKTTITKMFVVWCVVYRRKRFINWDAYDKGNAESALFDIATWLQTNRRLVADFGQLYAEDPRAAAQHKTMKRMSEFITANRVKVKAYSTQESTRGRIFDRFRPDLYVVEDFETEKTVRSVLVTAAIMKHIDELKAGLSVDGQVIFLANLISDSGSVAALLEEARQNPASWRAQQVSVVDKESEEVAWKAKYVKTDEEAAEINTNREPKERVMSLEQLKRDLNTGGRKVFEAEMLNDPESVDEPFFNREKVDADIKKAMARKPIRKIGEFRLYEEYNPKMRYAVGADTAKGVRRDSCASVAIRFKHESKIAAVMGAYASDTIKPDLFAYELRDQGSALGECLLAPELNNTGYATVTQLKALKYAHIYRQIRKDKAGKVVSDDLGWEATTTNVADIYYQFRTAYNDGEIEVLDMALLAEMRVFTRRDLEQGMRRTEVVTTLVTKHFDLLRAACIAFEMKNEAKVSKPKGYKQSTFRPVSEYQGG